MTLLSLPAQSANDKPKVTPVEIVGPSMLPVDVVNTVGVEIVGPSMLPVDVINTVEIVGPMFFPQEIKNTMISADGQPGVIDGTQVIREIVVLPSPSESAAVACRIHVSVGGVPIAHASWNGDEYGSFQLSLPGPIDVEEQAELVAQLIPLPEGANGECTADIVVIGTLTGEPNQ